MRPGERAASAEAAGAAAPTLALAEFAAGLDYGALPPAVKEQLSLLCLDYLRVASAGERMEWSRWARDLARRLGGTGGSWILFSGDRCDPVRATFVNATYAGSTDADDTHVGAMLHPGSVVFSAAFAIGQDRRQPGAKVLAAAAAGYEAMIRIALAVQPSHFRRGFQSTATCGVFGAAVAAATLLFEGAHRARRIAETIGLAASFCGGLTQFYHSGSTVKRIHAARAAAEGVHAALLAEAGFSGPLDALEGRDGFARAYADEADFGALCAGLGSEFRLREVMVKGHACSARMQAAIEAAAELSRAHAIGPAEVRRLRVGIPKVIEGRLTAPEPRDLQAAQMSVPFAVAMTVARAGRLAPGFVFQVDDFEKALADPAVAELARRIECTPDEEVERASTAESVGALVTVTLASGAEVSRFVRAPLGSASRPLTEADHLARFRHELGRRFSERTCEALLEAVRDLAASPDVGELARLLARAGRSA
jgi:2-methylcitrate dehydratase PrpD